MEEGDQQHSSSSSNQANKKEVAFTSFTKILISKCTQALDFTHNHVSPYYKVCTLYSALSFEFDPEMPVHDPHQGKI